MTIRNLILSHVIVFSVGVYAGKAIHADELNTYREAYESWPQKIQRKAGTVALGIAALGGLVMVVRLATRSSGGGTAVAVE
jgi:hypothetical protein